MLTDLAYPLNERSPSRDARAARARIEVRRKEFRAAGKLAERPLQFISGPRDVEAICLRELPASDSLHAC